MGGQGWGYCMVGLAILMASSTLTFGDILVHAVTKTPPKVNVLETQVFKTACQWSQVVQAKAVPGRPQGMGVGMGWSPGPGSSTHLTM